MLLLLLLSRVMHDLLRLRLQGLRFQLLCLRLLLLLRCVRSLLLLFERRLRQNFLLSRREQPKQRRLIVRLSRSQMSFELHCQTTQCALQPFARIQERHSRPMQSRTLQRRVGLGAQAQHTAEEVQPHIARIVGWSDRQRVRGKTRRHCEITGGRQRRRLRL